MRHELLFRYLVIAMIMSPNVLVAQEIIGKVIDSYTKADTTHCTLEVKKALVPGKNISLSDGNTVIVGEQLGEKDGIYYYDASAIGKPKIQPGTDVLNEEVKSFIKGKQMFLKLERKTTFAPKKYGEITAVQKDRALIDRGSLHEVDKRDLYAIYDAQGKYKGMIELRGIGDFQSSGKIYHTLEDINRNVTVEPGDKVKYLGQRKLFGLGLVVGAQLFAGKIKLQSFDTATPTYEVNGQIKSYQVVVKTHESTPVSYGGGLLWSLTFKDGWGVEVLFGGYFNRLENNFILLRELNNERNEIDVIGIDESGTQLNKGSIGWRYEHFIIAPIILKKNFLYPRMISPFIGIGVAYSALDYEVSRLIPQVLEVSPELKYYLPNIRGTQITRNKRKNGLIPVFTYGIDLFPGRFFRLRLDAKYFWTPDLETDIGTLRTRGWTYSLGFITAW